MMDRPDQIVMYSTAMGSIGALYPFTSREDIDFFVHLEMHMRQEHPPLCGRDHMAFRSAYFPVKDVVDGDLCSQFPSVRGNGCSFVDRGIYRVLSPFSSVAGGETACHSCGAGAYAGGGAEEARGH